MNLVILSVIHHLQNDFNSRCLLQFTLKVTFLLICWLILLQRVGKHFTLHLQVYDDGILIYLPQFWTVSIVMPFT
jgi:hypothetical protein